MTTAHDADSSANDLFLLSPKQRWMIQRNPPREAVQPAKGQGDPYLEAGYALAVANDIFSRDGCTYSTEIKVTQSGDGRQVKIPKGKRSSAEYRELDGIAVAFLAHARVTVHTPRGDIVREGIGTSVDSFVADDPNDIKRCFTLAHKGAGSYALKNALETYGPAFGSRLDGPVDLQDLARRERDRRDYGAMLEAAANRAGTDQVAGADSQHQASTSNVRPAADKSGVANAQPQQSSSAANTQAASPAQPGARQEAKTTAVTVTAGSPARSTAASGTRPGNPVAGGAQNQNGQAPANLAAAGIPASASQPGQAGRPMPPPASALKGGPAPKATQAAPAANYATNIQSQTAQGTSATPVAAMVPKLPPIEAKHPEVAFHFIDGDINQKDLPDGPPRFVPAIRAISEAMHGLQSREQAEKLFENHTWLLSRVPEDTYVYVRTQFQKKFNTANSQVIKAIAEARQATAPAASRAA